MKVSVLPSALKFKGDEKSSVPKKEAHKNEYPISYKEYKNHRTVGSIGTSAFMGGLVALAAKSPFKTANKTAFKAGGIAAGTLFVLGLLNRASGGYKESYYRRKQKFEHPYPSYLGK